MAQKKSPLEVGVCVFGLKLKGEDGFISFRGCPDFEFPNPKCKDGFGSTCDGNAETANCKSGALELGFRINRVSGP